jgi:transcriptional regulator with XRE-family HTH domain
MAKDKNLTYSGLAKLAKVEESTIKCFMCGANDSRRIAEKLADVLGISILYKNGEFIAVEKTED